MGIGVVVMVVAMDIGADVFIAAVKSPETQFYEL
jgi:hypothetical protein